MIRPASAVLLALGLLGAGCTTPGPGDGPDAGGDGDAIAPSQTRLAVDFDARRPVPGDVGGQWDATISSAHLDLSNLRATGDAGVASRPALSLDWNSELEPGPAPLDDARPGIYALLAASVDSYGLTGTVTVAGVVYDYEIVDAPTDVAMAHDLMGLEVVAGEETQVEIELDLKKLIEAITWNDVAPDGDGVLRVDASSPQIDSVRDELEDLLGEEEA